MTLDVVLLRDALQDRLQKDFAVVIRVRMCYEDILLSRGQIINAVLTPVSTKWGFFLKMSAEPLVKYLNYHQSRSVKSFW